ncbi:MAG: hypothetical protein IKY83_04080 [Proteobacteria bacterium]|nr:hypothetical protein [Pseudomonadota bacterium]
MDTISAECLDELTAAEAFELALEHALHHGPEAAEQPETGKKGFECLVLDKCMNALPFKPDYQVKSDLEAFSREVLHSVRAFFVKGAGTSEMAGTAGIISGLISKVCEPVGLEALTMIAVQITAALHGLMKKHARYERALYVMDGLDGVEPAELDRLKKLLLCLEDCRDEALEQKRAGGEIPVAGMRFVRPYRDEFLISGQQVVDMPQPVDDMAPGRLVSQVNADPRALPAYIVTIMHAPLTWLRAFLTGLEGIARQAVMMAFERITGVPHGTDMAAAVDLACRDRQAFLSWLRCAHASSRAGHRRVDVVLDALRRRELEDPEWYAGMLRYAWDEPAADGLEALPAGMEIFWRMEACRACGHAERGVMLFSEAMARGVESPVIWWLLAECHLDLKQFGQAEHALEQAGRRGSGEALCAVTAASRWQEMLSGSRFRLGRMALDQAKQSRVPESALLELAMTYGEDAVVAEAALCAFDGAICEPRVICSMLQDRREARRMWLESLVLRHDEARMDALYALSRDLENVGGCEGEVRLLEAASQVSDPYCAAMTLRRALDAMRPEDLMYWAAVDLWIDLETRQGAFDEAVMGVSEAFAQSHPRAAKALMFLIARTPKAAFGMIRDLLVSNIGLEATKDIFDRIRQGKHGESAPAAMHACSVDEMAEMLLPLPCVVLFREARLNAVSQADRMRAERRECVLRARGIVGSKYEHAPEPAEWEHHQQARASDAFKA